MFRGYVRARVQQLLAEPSQDPENDRPGGHRPELSHGHGGSTRGLRAREHALHRHRGTHALGARRRRACACWPGGGEGQGTERLAFGPLYGSFFFLAVLPACAACVCCLPVLPRLVRLELVTLAILVFSMFTLLQDVFGRTCGSSPPPRLVIVSRCVCVGSRLWCKSSILYHYYC